MTAYKKLYEEAVDQIAVLEKKLDELVNLDGMVAEVKHEDAIDFLRTFSDRAKNRAELALLIRVLMKIKD